MKSIIFPTLVVSLGLALGGCKPKEAGSGGGKDSAAATQAVTPMRQTSFDEVTRQLDPGGSVYGYLSTDQWLAGLSTNLARFKDLILSLPDISPQDSEQINRVFDLLTSGVAKSGVENLTGVGVSGVQITPELHRTKLILHHHAGQGDGLFWNMLGQQPHALTGMDLLTTNTAIAAFGDVDVAALWRAIEGSLLKSGVPELTEGIQQWAAEFEKQTQVSWPKFLASLGGEFGFVLTLDPANKIGLPLGEKGLEIPTPGLLLAVKVKDELLFNRISEELKKSQMVELTDEKGLKMCAMPIPLPLPMELKITVASSGDYFFVATSPQLVRDALAVRAGTQPGLRQTADCQELLKYLPAEGNQFTYVARNFSATIMELQKQMFTSEKNLSPGQLQLIQQLFLSEGPKFGLSIGAHTATGWQTVSVGNQDAATALLAAPTVGATAIGAAMLLPALAKAKAKAQSISCVNNLKQVGLAFLIWAGDSDDKFPFNVSTNGGGTMELCERGGDGYDRSAYRHFQVMSNELNAPKILVCPADSGKQAAADFANLQSWNVSYQVRTGPKVSDANPEEILTYCPIHHHVGYTDGSVKQGRKAGSAPF